MSEGDQISVELVAKIDGLVSGLAEATSALREAAGAMSGAFEKTGEAAKESESLMKTVLSGAAFLEFKEIASEALESIREAFERTVGAAEEFGLSNAKFAAMMGTSETEAAGLSAALHGVGSSAEGYSSIALRLQKTLESGTNINHELKESLKGANGETLQGAALMDRLREVLGTYSEEAQNAIVVQLGLGRRASDLYDAMRVGHEQVERQIAIYKEMGVQTEGLDDRTHDLEDKLNDLHTAGDALGISIGQKLTPTVTEIAKQLAELTPIAAAVSDAVVFMGKVAVTAAIGFTEAFVAAGAIVAGSCEAMVDALEGFGAVAYDVLTLHWKNIGSEAKIAWDKMKEDFTSDIDEMKSAFSGMNDIMDAMWGEKPKTRDMVSFERLGNPPPATGGGKKDRTQEQLAEADIQSAQKLAEAKIAIQEAANAHLLAMGRESIQAFVAQEVALENATYAVKQEALQKELQIPGKTLVERRRLYDEIVLLEETHQGKLDKIHDDGAQRERALAEKRLSDGIRDDNERLSNAMATIKEQYEAGHLSVSERVQDELALTATIKQQQLARLDAELATLTKETPAWEAAYRQREKIVADFDKKVSGITGQGLKDQISKDNQLAEPLERSFNSSLDGMLLHAKSFRESMAEMSKGIAQTFLEMVEKMAEGWIVKQIAMAQIAHAAQAASAMTQIPPLAAVAAAGAFASQAAIPIVGPALGSAAAAEAYAAVMSFEGIASAAGGMVLDKDQLVFAHKNEMVLPADIAQPMREMARGRGAEGGGGNTIHLNYSPVTHAHAEPRLSELLDKHGRDLLSWLAARNRDGALRGIIG